MIVKYIDIQDFWFTTVRILHGGVRSFLKDQIHHQYHYHQE